MTHLRLVDGEPREGMLPEKGSRETALLESETWGRGRDSGAGEPGAGGPFDAELSVAGPLPRGRHGIPADLVAADQRRRLLAAAAEALAEHGYGRLTAERVGERAGVSSRTFYKHFGNLWDCLLAAYEAGGELLQAEVEAACPEGGEPPARLAAGIDAGLGLLAAEPALAQLLGRQPPLEAGALADARRDLVDRLAAMLRRARGPGDETVRPDGLEERLIDAALAFASRRLAAGAANGDLTNLAPELTELLAGPHPAAAAAR